MELMPVSLFFSQMEKAYHAGDYDAVARCFALPGGVFGGDNVIVLENRASLLDTLKDQCSRNFSLGVRRARHKVVAQSTSRKNNYSVWVLWHHYDANDVLLNSFNARYFCKDDAYGVPQIQLVEFLELPACYSEQDFRDMTEKRPFVV